MIFLILCIAIIIVDQWTKHWAVANLLGNESIVILPKHLELTYVENKGAAFGILQGYQFLFYIITAIFIIATYYYIRKNKGQLSMLTILSLYLLIAGAIGNLIDRLRYSYVVDFIHLPLGGLYDFPVFNVADISVVSGCILLAITMILENKQ